MVNTVKSPLPKRTDYLCFRAYFQGEKMPLEAKLEFQRYISEGDYDLTISKLKPTGEVFQRTTGRTIAGLDFLDIQSGDIIGLELGDAFKDQKSARFMLGALKTLEKFARLEGVDF